MTQLGWNGKKCTITSDTHHIMTTPDQRDPQLTPSPFLFLQTSRGRVPRSAQDVTWIIYRNKIIASIHAQ